VVLVQLLAVCVKVKVVEPVATPVTTPALVTVAKPVLLLTQVPPAVGDTIEVLPTQTVDAADTDGEGLTVTVTLKGAPLQEPELGVTV